MPTEDKRDVLFVLAAVEGFVNLMASWAVILMLLHGARPHAFVGPAIVFLASAALLLLTCAGADLVTRSALTSRHAPSGHRRPR